MIKKFFTRAVTLAVGHKIASTIIIVIVIFGGYFSYHQFFATAAVVRYVSSPVTKGTLIATVSANGQVSVSNQIEVKPKASGDIVAMGVINGQEVKAGALLASLDARDALKAVRDAQVNLASAKLSLSKIEQPADTLSVTKARNTLDKATEDKQNAEADLVKAYEQGFNQISTTFLDLPTLMSGLDTTLNGNTITDVQSNVDYYFNQIKKYDDRADQFYAKAVASYNAARTSYDKNFDDYKNSSRFSDTATVESLVDETVATVKQISEAIKNMKNLVDFYQDVFTQKDIAIPNVVASQQTNLENYTATTNSDLTSLLTIQNTITTDKQAIVSADRNIAENTQSLANLVAGSDPLDIESQKLSVQQRENALLDAQQKLADYSVRAPFDGVVTGITAHRGDPASSGTTIATLITKQKIAEISLNEVDVARAKVGQKVTITFDAVDGLSVTGVVSDIDAVGTVTQGVVNYGVKVTFDVQDDRVKPGMSVSVNIITQTKSDVLLVPNAAVKNQNGSSYIQLLAAGAMTPQQQPVEVGISNDTMTEIISGVTEGQEVVTQTITTSTKSNTATTNSFLPGGGVRVQGGGNRGTFNAASR